jgi:hypothetical protein
MLETVVTFVITQFETFVQSLKKTYLFQRGTWDVKLLNCFKNFVYFLNFENLQKKAPVASTKKTVFFNILKCFTQEA